MTSIRHGIPRARSGRGTGQRLVLGAEAIPAQLADAMRALGQATAVRERQERLRARADPPGRALQRYRERTERPGSAERGRPRLGFVGNLNGRGA